MATILTDNDIRIDNQRLRAMPDLFEFTRWAFPGASGKSGALRYLHRANKVYGQRFGIEPMHKDWKSNAFDLEKREILSKHAKEKSEWSGFF